MSHDLRDLRERLDAILRLPDPDSADEDLVGFYVAVRRLLGHPPLHWESPGMGEILTELRDRLGVAEHPEPRVTKAVTFGHRYLVDEAGDGSGYRRRGLDADGGSQEPDGAGT
jgi:hypothetical protein